MSRLLALSFAVACGACTTPGGSAVALVQTGECESQASRAAATEDTGLEPASVHAEVDGERRIVVHFDNTRTNYYAAAPRSGAPPPETPAGVPPRTRCKFPSPQAACGNCCPTPEASYALDGAAIALAFVADTGESPCDCTCVLDFTVTTEPLGVGDWTLDVNDGEATFAITVR